MKNVVIGIIAVALAFVAGRLTSPTPETVTKVDKVVEKDIKETTTTTKNKDGSVVIVKTKDTSVKSETKKDVSILAPKVRVQAMYATQMTTIDADRNAYYGLAVSKALIGSINGGIFLMSNGKDTLGGLTLGVDL